MRIDRIRLTNFCGVRESEVRFAPRGVTIVHGPNETGKSTLMLGINILFDHRDDSKKEEVRRTKPVNLDTGSEVEADVEIGAYRFTYFKRFHKDRETRLTIHAPKAESLTGREGHERVQQILSASLDTNLWRALRIVQGENLDMPELHDQPAIAQALDRAAGQARSGEREEWLFEAAQAEYRAYFTDKGKEKEDPIGKARSAASAAAAGALELQEQLNALDADIALYAALTRESVTLGRSLAGLEAAVGKAHETWDAVSALSSEVERCRNAHQSSEQARNAAGASLQQRRQLIDTAENAASRVSKETAANLELAEALASAETARQQASEVCNRAIAIAELAEQEEKTRRGDQAHRKDEFELVTMEERLQRIKAAEAAASAAGDVIAGTSITEALRTRIREAELKLGTARGILDAASPQLHIRALRAATIVVNGRAETLAADEARTTPVTETVTGRLGDTIEFRVEPGTSAETLHQRMRDADLTLKRACEQAGVATPAAAESAWTALNDAKRIVDERDRIVTENLRDLTRQRLEALVHGVQVKVCAYLEKRHSALAMPADLDAATQLLAAAEKAAADAKAARLLAEAAHAQAHELHSKRREARAVNSALLEQARNDLKLAEDRLTEARNAAGDDALTQVLTSAENAFSQCTHVLAAARSKLGTADQQSAQTLLHTAQSALKRAEEQRAEHQRELLKLHTKLDLVGEKGLAEALAEARRVDYEAADALARLLRRAHAAKLLFETLQAERDAMRLTYVAPLREGIERLGRHLFGPTMRVEVDETLQVVSRTVEGVTVALAQLSTGAREQMGLLVRLATALIVASDGGVPLVLDDALGSTDPERLETMGAVLRIASQDTQTIILTCSPERYMHVGAQAMVRL